MSDVAVIRYLLTHNATMTAAVPAERIKNGTLPEGIELPAIQIRSISAPSWKPIRRGTKLTYRARVQITVHAKNYPSQKSLLALVKATLPRAHGIIAGADVASLTHDSDGPDFSDDDAGIYQQSVDYILTFSE
ncbi:hypothetical protein [Massilia sp. TS11]|uniref:tail completion protein gp17 n=1 Tax=Massilia sp. TS11 TaxID=2908003 RepID=UPI001EDAA728|nr:hypothetical protein [Massilia sp. TS11]MCG2586491.1 hypothetical protein [Massilia sp. TS11]